MGTGMASTNSKSVGAEEVALSIMGMSFKAGLPPHRNLGAFALVNLASSLSSPMMTLEVYHNIHELSIGS